MEAPQKPAEKAPSSDAQKSPDKGHVTGRPFNSKLLPHAVRIARWRRAGKTYKEMAALLKSEGLSVHPDTINSFVLVRARGGGKVAVLPPEIAPVAEPPATVSAASAAPAKPPLKAAQFSQSATPSVPAGGPSVVLKRVLGADGKPLTTAPYAPANPDEL